jgi:methylamine---corrinoid protein Co-methyltransferase
MEALEFAPHEAVYGVGRHASTAYNRNVEDKRDPIVQFSPVGTPVTEELFVPIVQGYAQDPMADTFSGPLITEFKGMGVASGSPVEAEAGIWNVMKLREAARLAGKPQMPIHNFMSIAERTDATIAAARPEIGALPGDGLFVAAVAELKVDYERLKKVSFLLNSEYVIGGLYGPLMGGYAGGPAETAALLVAHHFLGLFAFRAQRHNCFPVHIHHVCNTSRDMLWLVSATGQAMARNTHLVIFANAFMASGPSTEMITQELSAHSITATVSGWNLNPAATCKNRQPLHCSPMEPHIHGKVGHVTARTGITRRDANGIVKKLLDLYEKDLGNAPIGKPYLEVFDPILQKPRTEYVQVWEKTQKLLGELGLDFSTMDCV